jgi:hypothetical protein
MGRWLYRLLGSWRGTRHIRSFNFNCTSTYASLLILRFAVVPLGNGGAEREAGTRHLLLYARGSPFTPPPPPLVPLGPLSSITCTARAQSAVCSACASQIAARRG